MPVTTTEAPPAPTETSIIQPAALADLISAWRRRFGQAPVHPRRVLNAAVAGEQGWDLLAALDAVAPDFSRAPQPRPFVRWLTTIENLPRLDHDGAPYCLSCTEDNLWQLLPARSLVKADGV